MTELERPEWHITDAFRSIRDLGRQALAGLIARIDERYANALNEEDEV